jgi:copper resistance protein B
MPMPASRPVAKPPKKRPAARRAPTRRPVPHAAHAKPEPDDGPAAMPGMDMTAPASSPSEEPMAGMDMGSGSGDANAAPMPEMEMTGTALPAGNAPPPAPPMDHYAARQFPAAEIERAHREMMRESGGRTFAQVMFNLAEVQVRDGKDGYRWDGEGWFGGDIDRLVIKTEGEGAFREGVDAAEVQALYSRAIGPYFNLQAGVRHDFQPTPSRTYATVGFEGLAPYWFEVEGALFLSNKGDLLGRLEGYYDQRITQRLILQPRIELNLAAQDVPENRIGAGLTDAELGLRLRYEFSRKFAPYVGVSYEAKTGRTADYARADGKKATQTSFVAGIRFWF